MTQESAPGENQDIQDELRHRERQIDAIWRISDALFSRTSVDEMVRETLMIAVEVLCADVGSIQLHDPASDTLVFRYVLDPPEVCLSGHATPTSLGIAGLVFRTGTPDLTHRASEHPQFNPQIDAKTGYHTESMMTAPLKRFGGQPIGVMQILNARRHFDQRDLEVLEVLCAYAAATIENARLSAEARKAEVVNIVGSASHDIKNLMTPIQSGAATLKPWMDDMFEALDAIRITCPQAEPWSEQIEHAVQWVRREYATNLENAIESARIVQAFTDMVAGAVKGELPTPHFECANANSVAEAVMTLLHSVARQNRVTLRQDLDPDLPPVEMDHKQIFNALYNLVNNAIPETARGTVTIRTRQLPGEDALLIEVEDTGRGMSEEVRQRWGKADVKTTKKGGTGLGSRIVTNIIHSHGGTITVASSEGRGSTFSIHLPLRQKV